MLKTRLITAFFFSAVVIYILSFSPNFLFDLLFSILVSVAIALAGTEFAAMRWNIMDGPSYIEQPRPKLQFKHFLIGCSYGIHVFLFYICSILFKENIEKCILISIAWVFLCLFITTALVYKRAIDMHTASNKLLNVIAGFIYLSLPTICLLKFGFTHFEGSVRSAQLYFCFLTILLGDTGAYFVGTKFGKHKLIPKVSPKKKCGRSTRRACDKRNHCYYNRQFVPPSLSLVVLLNCWCVYGYCRPNWRLNGKCI